MSGPKSFPAVRLGQTGGERAGASVNDILLPGAPGSLGTERVFPRSWGRGCCFRGWSSNGRPSLSALPASLSAAWEVVEDRFEVGRAAAAGKRRSNRSCIPRRTMAVRRGRRAESFSKTEPAPNADADSTSRGLLLGPPYHKQIRHTVPFCAKAFSFPPLRRRLKVNGPAGAREAPLEGFFDAVKEKWGPCPPYIPSLGNMQKPGAATRSPPLLCALLRNFLHGKALDNVALPVETGFSWGPN